jgi:hypothetical protein
MTTIDIASAMADPDLFQPWFSGPSWKGWRVILKAAFAVGRLTTPERRFFHTVAERDPPKRRVKELWIVAGRRSGKDSIASLISAHAAALFDQQHRLRRGERALVMCLATDREQAKIILNYIKSYFTEIEPLAGMVTRETAMVSNWTIKSISLSQRIHSARSEGALYCARFSMNWHFIATKHLQRQTPKPITQSFLAW